MRKAFSSILAGAAVVAMSTPGFSQTLVNVFESTSITTANQIEYHAPSGRLLLGGTAGVQSVSRVDGSGAATLAGFTGTATALAASRSTGTIVAGKADGSLTIWTSPTDAAPTTKAIDLATSPALITGTLASLHLSGNVLVAGSTNSGSPSTDYVGYNLLSSGTNLNPVFAWTLFTGSPGPTNVNITATEDLAQLASSVAGFGLFFANFTFNPATLSSSYVSQDVRAEANFWVDGTDFVEAGDNNVGYVGATAGFGRKAISGSTSGVKLVGYRVVDTGGTPLPGNEIRLIDATGATVVTSVTLPAAFDTLRKQVGEGGDVVAFSVPANVQDWSLF